MSRYKVGDTVSFKSDTEQYGKVIAIRKSGYGGRMLTIECGSPEGFDGDYIGGQMTTVENEGDCWVE